MPQISIIMATFKRASVIHEAITTINNQTFPDWELIIIDNEPNHHYQFSNPKISCFHHSEEISAAYARNKGVEYAIGDLVCFFDDDDLMVNTYLEDMSRPFYDENIQMTHCGVKLQERHFDWSFGTPSCMVRKEWITPTWRNDHHGHDQTYWNEILDKVKEERIHRTQKVLVHAGTCRTGGLRGGGKF